MRITTLILGLLAVTGGAFSFHLFQVYQGKLRTKLWWMPPICRFSTSSCRDMADTQFGEIFAMTKALGHPLEEKR